jgi:hypothetical protein
MRQQIDALATNRVHKTIKSVMENPEYGCINTIHLKNFMGDIKGTGIT